MYGNGPLSSVYKIFNLIFLEKHTLLFVPFNLKFEVIGKNRDFPSGPVVKTLCFQCSRCGFDPCSGN